MLINDCKHCKYMDESSLSTEFNKCTHRETRADEDYDFLKYPYADLERQFWYGECGFLGKHFEAI